MTYIYEDLQQAKIDTLNQIEAEIERAEQIKNAEAAYKRKEITVEFLAWYRRFTAKAILSAAHMPKKAETK